LVTDYSKIIIEPEDLETLLDHFFLLCILDAVEKCFQARNDAGITTMFINLQLQKRLALHDLLEKVCYERVGPTTKIGDVDGKEIRVRADDLSGPEDLLAVALPAFGGTDAVPDMAAIGDQIGSPCPQFGQITPPAVLRPYKAPSGPRTKFDLPNIDQFDVGREAVELRNTINQCADAGIGRAAANAAEERGAELSTRRVPRKSPIAGNSSSGPLTNLARW
jgi:hypothetical protein